MRQHRALLRTARTEHLVLQALLRLFSLMQCLATLVGHRDNMATSIGGVSKDFIEIPLFFRPRTGCHREDPRGHYL